MKKMIEELLKSARVMMQSDVIKEMIRLNPVRFSLFGIGLALIFSFMFGTEKSNRTMRVPEPISLPYTQNICANGVVEANSKNITLGVFQTGIIKQIFVKENDTVKKGDLLIQLDDQLLLSQEKVQSAALKAAQAMLAFKKATYQEAQDLVNRAQMLKMGVISEEEIKKREFALERATADVEATEQNVKQAIHALETTQTQLAQTQLRAPIDGTILKVYPSVGEFLSNDGKTIVLGNTTPLHVVAQIDETEIGHFNETAKACAIDRSGSNAYIPLKFIKIVPLTSSKTNLSGASNELIDTRIIEVTFEITEPKKLFIGQRLDVFIEKAAS